jgi:hypothetical protein
MRAEKGIFKRTSRWLLLNNVNTQIRAWNAEMLQSGIFRYNRAH